MNDMTQWPYKETRMNVQGVHTAINAVQAALAKEGIGKDRKNQMQGYNFRGIDDMYNVIAPLFAAHGLVVLPKYSERQVVERESAKGGALFYVTLRGDFRFVASDGTFVEATTYGEAMDSGDKATNKAMSAALKYAFMQTFTIPTEGDNDSENHTHEVRAATITPTTGAWESMPIDVQNMMLDTAYRVGTLLQKGDKEGACVELTDAVRAFDGREDYMTAQWTRFDSAQRRALKDAGFKFQTNPTKKAA